MEKVKLAACIGDCEYRNRFMRCLMGHYRDRFELHVFSEGDQLLEETGHTYDVLLCADCPDRIGQIAQMREEPLLYLWDEQQEEPGLSELMEGERIVFVDKYQEVNRIVDEILQQVAGEIREVKEQGRLFPKTQIHAVYSLAENEYQLPFVVTLASILGEHAKVLVLDLQENSGLSRMAEEQLMGLEELLVMAESGKYTKRRLLSCISHMEKMDIVYPAKNTECICEAGKAAYMRMLRMLQQELDYEVILLNLGARFVGFFEVLSECQEIYLMRNESGLCRWRECEFSEELNRKGYSGITERMTKVAIPPASEPVTSCERLVEQWKWNEFGDLIRRMNPGVAQIG
jgi:hypothetical protein